MSIGTTDATYAARTTDRDLACGCPADPLLELGMTVGNRSAGFSADTPVPGSGGSDCSGTIESPDELLPGVFGATTMSVASAE